MILFLSVIMVWGAIPISAMSLNFVPWKAAGWRWANNQQITFIAHSGFGDLTMSQFNDALWQWNRHNLSSVMLRRDPSVRHTRTFTGISDGRNSIYRQTYSDGFLGLCRIYTSGTVGNYQRAVESDIIINTRHSFHNNPTTASHGYDTWSVFLHEAGHTLGLDDVNYSPNPVMHWTLSSGVQRRVPLVFDSNGINAIY